MIRKISEAVAAVCCGAAWYVVYCVLAACWYGQPFHPSAYLAARILVYGAAAAVALLAAWIVWLVVGHRRRPRRLGMIRMDRNGGFYLTRK